MAKYGVTNIAGGGGVGSDEISVTKEYVLDGKTYVGADTDDEIGIGKMANNGTTANQSLNASGSFYIKKGYHAQDFTVIANSLASQTPGTATAGSILNGDSAYVNGNKITGSMPNYSSTPTAIDAIRINNNRFEVAVARGFHGYSWANGGYEYLSYDQIANAIGLTPEKLKKGVRVCGRTGTWEGWVPQPTDIYYRGTNTSLGYFGHDGNGNGTFTAQTGGLRAMAARPYMYMSKVDLSRYNRINVEFRFDGNAETSYPLSGLQNYWMRMSVEDSPNTFKRVAGSGTIGAGTNLTLSVGLENLDMTTGLYIYITLAGRYWWDWGDDSYDWNYNEKCRWNGWVYRIWLS